MQRRALAIACWLVVASVGMLGVLRPFGTAGTQGWFRGFWALYLVMGAVGMARSLRGHRLAAGHCLVAGGVGTVTVATIAPETSGFVLPAVVHAALLTTGLAILAAARPENRPHVGLAVTVGVSLAFLASAIVADGAVGRAILGLLIGPVTAGILLGVPLVIAVRIGNRMAFERGGSDLR